MTVAYGRYKQVDADFTSRVKSGPQGKVHDAPVTLTVTVTKVAFRDEATGFFIVNTAEGVSVKGNSMFIGEGVKLVVTGKWKNGTGNWPMYIYADKVALAEQGDAIKVLLGSGFLKGVKMKMAESIANHYGDNTFSQLDEALIDPKKLTAVKGIGPVNCSWIVDSWRAQRHWAKAALVAIRVGLTMRQAKEAYEAFGQPAGGGHQRQPIPAHDPGRRHLGQRRRDRCHGVEGQEEDRSRRPETLRGGRARGAAPGLQRWPHGPAVR